MSHSNTVTGLFSLVSIARDNGSRTHRFRSQLSHITYLENDYEIISMFIVPFLLIQEGQLQAKVCAQVLVNRLED